MFAYNANKKQKTLASNYIIFFFWALFAVGWRVSARSVKKDLRDRTSNLSFKTRYLYYITNILYLPFFEKAVGISKRIWSVSNPTIILVGIGICAVGLVLSISSRLYLGKNWSSFPSIKENHELVSSGPYRFIRHPIYTGILTMIFGSILAEGALWVFVFVVFLVTYLGRLNAEEKLMTGQFPGLYSEYKKRTNRLVPFLY